MNRLPLALVVLSLLSACAASRTTAPAGKGSSANAPGDNNVIAHSSENVYSGVGGGKTIFEGSGNLFEVVQQNAAYFDQPHDVVIIKGSNNLIRAYNINLVTLGGKGADTLVIVGNNVKYVVDVSNSLRLKKQGYRVDTVQLKTTPADVQRLAGSLSPDAYFNARDEDGNVETQSAIDYFTRELAFGNAQAYYELADIYHFGKGVPESTPRALELYEYAAVQNHIESIRKLGNIYRNGTFDFKPDRVKARYYYTLGRQLGDAYCADMLRQL
ncbi:sel1 repeat family protein [Hymenobacter sp. BT175]|uniref:tetratricopeptide repeat protein n=1 Tax=Hymenobacter translucens TaxID=2886507 RepID=UPI001D0EBE82|nr:tetratricopeptide repeat protein [Hymenobacter translucens]MCC2546596.1 sel1 repeat family protein [Hymenobacter translucens]